MSLFFASTIAPRCVRHPLALCCAAALAASVPLSARAADDAGLADPIELNRVEVHADAVAGYGAPPSSAGTGLRLTARETPQSVSVLTRDQLDDFGLDNLNDALDAAPGISVERVETGRTYYTARGFDISNFQFDGLGVPLPYGIQDGDIDLAMFDRVEVLRGANGLMSATGNPSATINFVRKRPTAAFEGAVQATLGSWDRQRLDLDVGGPLGSDAVRGRLVAAYEDGDSHLDRYGLEKSLVYGVVEADLGPSTRLTAGLSHQDNNADSPLWGALPLFYADGSPTSYGRSTSTATDWAYWDTRDTRAFAEIAHAFGNGWSLRAAFNHQDKDQDSELFYVYGTPDRDTGLGLFAYPSAYAGTARSRHVDVRASGPLALGGRRHEAVAGASWAESRVRELSWYGNDVGTPLGAGGAFDGRYPKPTFDSYSDGSDFEFRRDTLYANVRWDLADTFKLITGANHARVRMAGTGYGTPKDSEVTRTTPFVGAVWDIASAYSLYASYGGIFAQQTELDASGAPLEAIEGSSLEAGLKGAWFDGRLNASAAVFRVEQDNLARYVGFDVDSGRSVYAGEDARSTGVELELSGEVGEVWSLSAGWTRLRIEDDAGDDSRPYVPRTTLRAAAVARIDAVPGLRVGGSVRWQGDIWQPVVLPDGTPARVEQDAYAVVGLMAGYRLRSGWDATLNLDNVTDRRYITSLYSAGQGFYAAPRSVSLTLGYRF